MLRVVLGNKFDPEMVIEAQIKQRTVEIEKYRLNVIPVDHGLS